MNITIATPLRSHPRYPFLHRCTLASDQLRRSFVSASTSVRCRAQPEERETSREQLIVYGTSLALTFGSLATWFLFRDAIEDVVYGGGLFSLFETPISLGDISAVTLWTVAYYFVSPLQLLLIFLGRFEKQRPSDWILERLSRALNQPTDAEGSLGVYGLTWGAVFGMGLLTAAGLKLAFGDATWGVSSGIGACMAAGVFEISRPERLTPSEKAALAEAYLEFTQFAEERLARVGSCHESEIYRAYQLHKPTSDLPSDLTLRQFIKQWAPKSKRTSRGYLKRLSLKSEGPL